MNVAALPLFALSIALATPALAQAEGPDAPISRVPLASHPLAPTSPRPLKGDSFCQVAGADRVPYGVAVYFSERMAVTVTSPDGYSATRTYDPAALPATEWKDSEGPVLYPGLGSSFSFADGTGGTCRGTVIHSREGLLALQMRADFTADGKADSAEELIYAQPTDAAVREGKSSDYDFHASWPRAVDAIPALRRDFAERARKDERELAALASDLGTPREEVNLPRQIMLAHFDSTRVAGDSGRLLSLLSDIERYTGGAHGASGKRARIWDRKTRTLITDATPLFADGLAVMRDAWCDALDAQRIQRSEGRHVAGSAKYLDNWDCPGFDRLSVVATGEPGRPFDRLRIIAQPYIAGPWSDGSYDITFPVTEAMLAQVKPEYRADFALYQWAVK